MAKTGQQLVDIVIENIGNRTDKDSLALNMINQTIKAISANPRHEFDVFQETHSTTVTAALGRSYALETRLKSIIRVHLIQDSTQYYRLERVGIERAEDTYMNGRAFISGRPFRYWIWGGEFFLDRTPDQSYTVEMRITRVPADMALGDTQPFREEVEKAIIAGATAEMMRSLQEHDDARAWERIYQKEMDYVIASEKSKPDWTPRQSPRAGAQNYYEPSDPFSPTMR